MSGQLQLEEEQFASGQTIPVSGDCGIVDQDGNKTSYDAMTLDEGDKFPVLSQQGFYYVLLQDDQTLVIPEIDMPQDDEESGPNYGQE